MFQAALRMRTRVLLYYIVKSLLGSDISRTTFRDSVGSGRASKLRWARLPGRLWLPEMLHFPQALRHEGCWPRGRILKSKGLGPRTHGLFHPPHFTTVLLRSFIKSLRWAISPVTPVHCTRQYYFLMLTFVSIIKRGLVKLKNKVYFHLCVGERHMDEVEIWKHGTYTHQSGMTQNASSFKLSH